MIFYHIRKYIIWEKISIFQFKKRDELKRSFPKMKYVSYSFISTDCKIINMNSLKLMLPVIISLFLISCDPKKEEQKLGPPPVSVDIMIAEMNDFTSSIEVNGTVLSEDMVELRSEISGRITYLNIPDGAMVSKGTILVRINDVDLQAQLEQQKVQLDLSVKTEQRLKTLLNVNGIDQATYDASLNEVHIREAAIKVIRAQIEKTIIRAPFSGRLGLRLVSLGAYVSPTTLIGTLTQSDQIKIDFSVPETYENLVKVGNTVKIETTHSNQKLIAEIHAIEPQINTATRNLKVRARLKTGTVRPGSFVKVYLTSNKKTIVVPTNAIIPDALSNMVFIVKKNKAVYRKVETGMRTPDNIEIVSGIEPGDSVVVTGVLFLRPNGDVKIKKILNSEQ
jgi:membrane fusion protein (multidrug efflux system)